MCRAHFLLLVFISALFNMWKGVIVFPLIRGACDLKGKYEWHSRLRADNGALSTGHLQCSSFLFTLSLNVLRFALSGYLF